MSDTEEENYGFYGKPLEQYDKDAHPKKRPITVEEQIATDAQGRRRFHGAFTGGFSAGFYNTVGSLEGWKPSEFKSSRSEKAATNKRQRPEDYMDDEDVGEFGIAPQTVRATDDYNTSKKKKKKIFADGPIPGDPVLHSLIECGNETIGYLLLRNMCYKHGEAENQQQIVDDEEEESGSTKIYGCEMPSSNEIKKTLENITYKIPEIYLKSLTNPKTNTFGLGYSGLDKSHINLFVSSNLVVRERNNKKLSIAGQAFGVGAFEDEDEDIYVKEDLSKYDFELTSDKKSAPIKAHSNLLYDIFSPSIKSFQLIEAFAAPVIPHSFTGKHKVKRSRFEPVKEPVIAPKRHEIDATVRATYLGENSQQIHTPSNQQHRVDEPIDSSSNLIIQSKPVLPLKTENKLLSTNTTGLIFDRFVSASKSEDHVDLMEPVQSSESEHGTKDMRDAAKMKMYGPLTRVTIDWAPSSLVCKRFNVPEPNFCEDELKPRIRKPINLIFENEKYVSQPPAINKSGLQNNEPISSSLESIEKNTPEIIEIALTPPPSQSNLSVDISSREIDIPTKSSQPTVVTKSLDDTEKIDISKNADLFKAIFLDSDDESDDDDDKIEETKIIDEEEEKAREDEVKEQLLSQDILLPKIKPMKEGILSNVSFIKFTKPGTKKETDIIQEPEAPIIIEDPNTYGPKLPEKIVQKHVFKIKDTIVHDEWVEKAESTKGKEHKHKKKNKKEKHKKKHKK